jgi:hypothetical protein
MLNGSLLLLVFCFLFLSEIYSVHGALVTCVQVSSVWRYVRNILPILHEGMDSVMIQSMPCEDALKTMYVYIHILHILHYIIIYISYPCNRQWRPIRL